MNMPTRTPKIPKMNFSAIRPRTAKRPMEKMVRSILVSRTKSKCCAGLLYGTRESTVSPSRSIHEEILAV